MTKNNLNMQAANKPVDFDDSDSDDGVLNGLGKKPIGNESIMGK